jgi:hypothetical protein
MKPTDSPQRREVRKEKQIALKFFNSHIFISLRSLGLCCAPSMARTPMGRAEARPILLQARLCGEITVYA